MKNFDMEWIENKKVNMAYVSAVSAEEAIARIKKNRPNARLIEAQERKVKVTEKTYTTRTYDGRELRQYIVSESERAFFTWEEAQAFIVARLQKSIENAQQAIAHNEALLARVAQYEPGKPYQERFILLEVSAPQHGPSSVGEPVIQLEDHE